MINIMYAILESYATYENGSMTVQSEILCLKRTKAEVRKVIADRVKFNSAVEGYVVTGRDRTIGGMGVMMQNDNNECVAYDVEEID